MRVFSEEEDVEDVMDVVTNAEGTPAGGYKVVADILATNSRHFKPTESAMEVAIDMVTSGAGGGPVVGDQYEFLGFINEGDLIRAMESGVDLKKASASDIMNTAFVGVKEDTSLSCVSRMFEMGFQILPVVQDGKVTRSITRHDLLRAVARASGARSFYRGIGRGRINGHFPRRRNPVLNLMSRSAGKAQPY